MIISKINITESLRTLAVGETVILPPGTEHGARKAVQRIDGKFTIRTAVKGIYVKRYE